MILDKKHAMQQKLFRQFAETEFTKELQEELDTTGAFNWDIHNKMAKYGFMGVKIPVEYGGAGGDYLSYVIMNEEMKIIQVIGGYQEAQQFEPMIHYFGDEAYKAMSGEDFLKEFKSELKP